MKENIVTIPRDKKEIGPYYTNVDYKSQYLDIANKMDALTACGITCLYIILKTFKTNTKLPELEEMVKTGKEDPAGYMPETGWVHQYFVDLAKKYGLDAYRKTPFSLEEIKNALDVGSLIISSCNRKFLGRLVSTHMIVITGYSPEGIYYVDPASITRTQQNDHYLALYQDFEKDYNNHSIIIGMPNTQQ
jgi:uncharacterized protein YvpB